MSTASKKVDADSTPVAKFLRCEAQISKLSKDVEKLISISTQHGSRIRELFQSSSNSVSHVEFMSAITTTRFQQLNIVKSLKQTNEEATPEVEAVVESKESKDSKDTVVLKQQIKTLETELFNSNFKYNLEMKKLEHELKVSRKDFFELRNQLNNVDNKLYSVIYNMKEAGVPEAVAITNTITTTVIDNTYSTASNSRAHSSMHPQLITDDEMRLDVGTPDANTSLEEKEVDDEVATNSLNNSAAIRLNNLSPVNLQATIDSHRRMSSMHSHTGTPPGDTKKSPFGSHRPSVSNGSPTGLPGPNISSPPFRPSIYKMSHHSDQDDDDARAKQRFTYTKLPSSASPPQPHFGAPFMSLPSQTDARASMHAPHRAQSPSQFQSISSGNQANASSTTQLGAISAGSHRGSYYSQLQQQQQIHAEQLIRDNRNNDYYYEQFMQLKDLVLSTLQQTLAEQQRGPPSTMQLSLDKDPSIAEHSDQDLIALQPFVKSSDTAVKSHNTFIHDYLDSIVTQDSLDQYALNIAVSKNSNQFPHTLAEGDDLDGDSVTTAANQPGSTIGVCSTIANVMKLQQELQQQLDRQREQQELLTEQLVAVTAALEAVTQQGHESAVEEAADSEIVADESAASTEPPAVAPAVAVSAPEATAPSTPVKSAVVPRAKAALSPIARAKAAIAKAPTAALPPPVSSTAPILLDCRVLNRELFMRVNLVKDVRALAQSVSASGMAAAHNTYENNAYCKFKDELLNTLFREPAVDSPEKEVNADKRHHHRKHGKRRHRSRPNDSSSSESQSSGSDDEGEHRDKLTDDAVPAAVEDQAVVQRERKNTFLQPAQPPADSTELTNKDKKGKAAGGKAVGAKRRNSMLDYGSSGAVLSKQLSLKNNKVLDALKSTNEQLAKSPRTPAATDKSPVNNIPATRRTFIAAPIVDALLDQPVDEADIAADGEDVATPLASNKSRGGETAISFSDSINSGSTYANPTAVSIIRKKSVALRKGSTFGFTPPVIATSDEHSQDPSPRDVHAEVPPAPIYEMSPIVTALSVPPLVASPPKGTKPVSAKPTMKEAVAAVFSDGGTAGGSASTAPLNVQVPVPRTMTASPGAHELDALSTTSSLLPSEMSLLSAYESSVFGDEANSYPNSPVVLARKSYAGANKPMPTIQQQQLEHSNLGLLKRMHSAENSTHSSVQNIDARAIVSNKIVDVSGSSAVSGSSVYSAGSLNDEDDECDQIPPQQPAANKPNSSPRTANNTSRDHHAPQHQYSSGLQEGSSSLYQPSATSLNTTFTMEQIVSEVMKNFDHKLTTHKDKSHRRFLAVEDHSNKITLHVNKLLAKVKQMGDEKKLFAAFIETNLEGVRDSVDKVEERVRQALAPMETNIAHCAETVLHLEEVMAEQAEHMHTLDSKMLDAIKLSREQQLQINRASSGKSQKSSAEEAFSLFHVTSTVPPPVVFPDFTHATSEVEEVADIFAAQLMAERRASSAATTSPQVQTPKTPIQRSPLQTPHLRQITPLVPQPQVVNLQQIVPDYEMDALFRQLKEYASLYKNMLDNYTKLGAQLEANTAMLPSHHYSRPNTATTAAAVAAAAVTADRQQAISSQPRPLTKRDVLDLLGHEDVLGSHIEIVRIKNEIAALKRHVAPGKAVAGKHISPSRLRLDLPADGFKPDVTVSKSARGAAKPHAANKGGVRKKKAGLLPLIFSDTGSLPADDEDDDGALLLSDHPSSINRQLSAHLPEEHSVGSGNSVINVDVRRTPSRMTRSTDSHNSDNERELARQELSARRANAPVTAAVLTAQQQEQRLEALLMAENTVSGHHVTPFLSENLGPHMNMLAPTPPTGDNARKRIADNTFKRPLVGPSNARSHIMQQQQQAHHLKETTARQLAADPFYDSDRHDLRAAMRGGPVQVTAQNDARLQVSSEAASEIWQKDFHKQSQLHNYSPQAQAQLQQFHNRKDPQSRLSGSDGESDLTSRDQANQYYQEYRHNQQTSALPFFVNDSPSRGGSADSSALHSSTLLSPNYAAQGLTGVSPAAPARVERFSRPSTGTYLTDFM